MGERCGLGQRAVGLNGFLRHGRQQPPSLAQGGGEAPYLLVLLLDAGLLYTIDPAALVDVRLLYRRVLRAVVQFGRVAVGLPSDHPCRSVAFCRIIGFGGLRTVHPLVLCVVHQICPRRFDGV